MIEIINVTKKFYNITAINNVSLNIPQGEVLGLLGPNGAGKSTLMKLIAGILFADTGQIRPRGAYWPTIGYKPERLLYPNHMTISQYLEMVAKISNISSSSIHKVVYESLTQVHLLNEAGKRIRDCSKGMRQRLGIAQVLIGDPPLLLLDEPSNGLDPAGQAEIIQCISKLHTQGKTIVMSSHQLHEVKEACTQLAILNNGQLLYSNSMVAALSQTVYPFYISIKVDRSLEEVQSLLESIHAGIKVEAQQVILQNEATALRRQILAILLNTDYDIVHVEQKRNSLTDIYNEVVQ